MDSLSDTVRAQIAASFAAQTAYEEQEPEFQRKVPASLYRHALLQHSFRERARYDPEFHGTHTMGMVGEEDYYRGMIESLRNSLSLYPHQLADVIAGRLRVTPFDYYSGMLVEVIRGEQAYDSLPNWTAADCKRVIGVGRNEFINIMNQYRSKGWLSKQRRRTTIALLPETPCCEEICPEWRACCVCVTEEEVLQLDDETANAVQYLMTLPHYSCLVTDLGMTLTKSLYKQGLVWLDVPVSLQDRIKILPLHNFVMNKDCTGEDRFEMLLYELLISHDQRSSVEQLAHVLGSPRDMVQRAIGLYLRLGFASKIAVSEEAVEDDEERLPMTKRIGLLFDSQLPGALMMGNLSKALKAHAVTLFEAGKLSDESMEPFLEELKSLPAEIQDPDPDDPSYLHAYALRGALTTLRHNPACTTEGTDGGVDLLRIDSLHALGEPRKSRVLAHHYTVLMSLSPLDAKVKPVTAPPPLVHFGPTTAAMHSPWLKMWLFDACGGGPVTFVYPRGTVLQQLPRALMRSKSCLVHAWGSEPTTVSRGVLLVQLNECLSTSPVLVHTTDYADMEHLALPLLDSRNDEADSVNSQLLTWDGALAMRLTMGQLTVARFQGHLVPIDLALGLSVTNLDKHTEVLSAMQANKLLTHKLDQCRQASDDLAASLDLFVSKYAAPDLEAGGSRYRWRSGNDEDREMECLWPRQTLHFDGRRFVELEATA